MNCNNKIKHTCSTKNYATCIYFEGTPNPQSELFEEECFSIEEAVQDNFDQLETIWGEIDLADLGDLCLEYTTEEGKTVVKNVLLKFEETICELKEKINILENRPLCDFPLSDCVDLACLGLPCEQEILTFGDWMNAVTARICD